MNHIYWFTCFKSLLHLLDKAKFITLNIFNMFLNSVFKCFNETFWTCVYHWNRSKPLSCNAYGWVHSPDCDSNMETLSSPSLSSIQTDLLASHVRLSKSLISAWAELAPSFRYWYFHKQFQSMGQNNGHKNSCMLTWRM